MAQVTSPIILDSTGQQIHSDLQQIKNVLTTPSAAADITFDNTGTGMQADDVQDAITELKSNLTQLIPNANKIYFRKQTGTFTNGAVTGLDCPSGFNNGDLVFLSCKYQNSMTGAVLTVGLSSVETTTTYTVYGSNTRGGVALSNGSYTWFELWVKVSS